MKAPETKHCSCPDCRGSVMNECSQAAVEVGNRAERERLLAENRELLETRQYLESECQNLGKQVAEQTVGSVDRRPNLSSHKRCAKCGARHSALVLCPELPECPECCGKHERSGARTDCIRHWKYRALEAENKLLVQKVYGV